MPKREKVAVVPAAWAKIHRMAQRRMLLEEKRALLAIRAILERESARIVSAVASAADGHERAAAIEALHHAHQRLVDAVAQAVSASRVLARASAHTQLRAELAQAEKALRAAGYNVTFGAPPAKHHPSDDAHGRASGSSLAAAWSGIVLATITTWIRKDSEARPSLSADLRRAPDMIDYRAKRIAATEVARAHNEEHDEGVGYVAREHRRAAWIAAWIKRWDATLDRRVCPTCSALDGTIALPTQSWDGVIPGDVHANCRCTSTALILPARLPRAAAAGEYVGSDVDAA